MKNKKKIKNKKINWDSLIPISGLNPQFFPSKDDVAIAAFNNMQGNADVGEACFENLEENLDSLTEAAFNDTNVQSAIKACFSSNVTKIMNNLKNSNNPKIQNIEKISDIENKDGYLNGAVLNPKTVDLLFVSNVSGQKDVEAKITQTIIHHVFCVHPRNKDEENAFNTITVYMTLQDHTALHNKIAKAMTEKALSNEEIKQDAQDYINTIKNLNNALLKAESPAEAADKFWRKVEAKAWFIRKVWSSEIITDLNNYKNLIAVSDLKEYLSLHPDYIKFEDGKPININGIPYYVIIDDVNNTHINDLNRYVKGNELTDFPETLKPYFIAAVKADDKKDAVTDFDAFLNLFGTLQESLKPSINDFKELSKAEMQKILTFDLSNNIPDNKDEFNSKIADGNAFWLLAKQYAKKYPETASYSSDTYKLKNRLDNTSYYQDKLKQDIIQNYIDFILNQHSRLLFDSKILIKNKFVIDKASGYYLIPTADVIIRVDGNDYLLNAEKTKINLEHIIALINDDKIIPCENITLDTHFLDSNNNPVDGITFSPKYSSITSILKKPDCDVDSIVKIIIDRNVSASSSLNDILENAGLKNIKTVEFAKDSLTNNTSFQNLKCDKIDLTSSTINNLSDNTFIGLDCPEIIIPDSIVSIGDNCFLNSKIKSIFIPETVNILGLNCFKNCRDLQVNFEAAENELSEGIKNSNWGKQYVRAIKYNCVEKALENLAEALFDDLPDDVINNDFGDFLTSTTEYIVYKMTDRENIAELRDYLASSGNLSYQDIDLLLPSKVPAYFIEHRNDISKSIVIEKPVAVETVNGESRLNNVFYNQKNVFDTIIFDADISFFTKLRKELDDRAITKNTSIDDDKYYVSCDIKELSRYCGWNKKLFIILNFIERNQLASVLDFLDIEYPQFKNYIPEIKNYLCSDEGIKILKNHNITESEITKAFEEVNDLHNILSQAALLSATESMCDHLKNYIHNIIKNSKSMKHCKIDFTDNTFKMNIIDLYVEIISGILDEEVVYNLMRDKLSNILKSVDVDDIFFDYKYNIDKNIFLNNLDNILTNYYN